MVKDEDERGMVASMATTLQDVLKFIRDPKLDLDDRQAIIDALNSQTRARRQAAKAGLRVGMQVTWYSSSTGQQMSGRITKINRVNCDVMEDGNGFPWRISPQLLSPV